MKFALILVSTLISLNLTAQGFSRTIGKSIDVLVLVDNSGSMQRSQENFIQKLPTLFAQYKESNLHLALITTDDNETLFYGQNTIGSWEEILTGLAKDIRRSGTQGSASEQHFTQILRTFEDPIGKKFHRYETPLHIYIVTDEDEQTMEALPFVWELQKFKKVENVLINLAIPSGENCKSEWINWDKSILKDAADFFKGQIIDICTK